MIKSENGTVMIEGYLTDVLADLQTLLYGIVHDNDIPINKNTLVLMASNADHRDFGKFIPAMLDSMDRPIKEEDEHDKEDKFLDPVLKDLFNRMFGEGES